MPHVLHELAESLIALSAYDKRVVVVGATQGLVRVADAHPSRFIDVSGFGQHMLGLVAGMSRAGRVPVVVGDVAQMLGGNWENIRTLIAQHMLPVKFVGISAGMWSRGGSATYCFEDITLMRVLPNMRIVVPIGSTELHKTLFSVVSNGAPTYVRVPDIEVSLQVDDSKFREGGAYYLWRSEHPRVVLLGAGPILHSAVSVARALEAEGLGTSVLNVHTIKPMDLEIVKSAIAESRAVVTLETHQILGGIGGTIAEITAQNTPVPVEMLAVHDRFGCPGSTQEVLQTCNLHEEAIRSAVYRVLERKG